MTTYSNFCHFRYWCSFSGIVLFVQYFKVINSTIFAFSLKAIWFMVFITVSFWTQRFINQITQMFVHGVLLWKLANLSSKSHTRLENHPCFNVYTAATRYPVLRSWCGNVKRFTAFKRALTHLDFRMFYLEFHVRFGLRFLQGVLWVCHIYFGC